MESYRKMLGNGLPARSTGEGEDPTRRVSDRIGLIRFAGIRVNTRGMLN